MKDYIGDEGLLMNKEVYLSVLFWAVVAYVVLFVLGSIGFNLLGSSIIKIESGIAFNTSLLMLSGLFLSIIPAFALGAVFYFALRRNWKRFKLKTYDLKFSYVILIFLAILIMSLIVEFIITRKFKFPDISLLTLAVLFITPSLFKNKKDII
jgi:hypothetical protein